MFCFIIQFTYNTAKNTQMLYVVSIGSKVESALY